jgi:hypothetical protein
LRNNGHFAGGEGFKGPVQRPHCAGITARCWSRTVLTRKRRSSWAESSKLATEITL